MCVVRWCGAQQMKNRRVYVLFNVEPGKDPGGGPWYVNGNFDEEFFDTLLIVCAPLPPLCLL